MLALAKLQKKQGKMLGSPESARKTLPVRTFAGINPISFNDLRRIRVDTSYEVVRTQQYGYCNT